MKYEAFSKRESDQRLNSGVMSPLMIEGMRILYQQGWKLKELAVRYGIEKKKVIKHLETDGVL